MPKPLRAFLTPEFPRFAKATAHPRIHETLTKYPDELETPKKNHQRVHGTLTTDPYESGPREPTKEHHDSTYLTGGHWTGDHHLPPQPNRAPKQTARNDGIKSQIDPRIKRIKEDQATDTPTFSSGFRGGSSSTWEAPENWKRQSGHGSEATDDGHETESESGWRDYNRTTTGEKSPSHGFE